MTITELDFKPTMLSDGFVDNFETHVRILARHDLSSSKEPARDKVMRK